MTFSAQLASFFALILGFLASPFSGTPALAPLTGADRGPSVFAGAERYATDTTGVYYRGAKVDDADPSHFSIVDAFYAKDASHVYFVADPLSPTSSPVVLPGADPKTLTLCPNDMDRDDCVRDAHTVYIGGSPIPQADPHSYIMLNDVYGKDASHVYYNGVVVPDADPSTFSPFMGAEPDARDSRTIYQSGVPLPEDN